MHNKVLIAAAGFAAFVTPTHLHGLQGVRVAERSEAPRWYQPRRDKD
jgi:hypothetical protein